MADFSQILLNIQATSSSSSSSFSSNCVPDMSTIEKIQRIFPCPFVARSPYFTDCFAQSLTNFYSPIALVDYFQSHSILPLEATNTLCIEHVAFLKLRMKLSGKISSKNHPILSMISQILTSIIAPLNKKIEITYQGITPSYSLNLDTTFYFSSDVKFTFTVSEPNKTSSYELTSLAELMKMTAISHIKVHSIMVDDLSKKEWEIYRNTGLVHILPLLVKKKVPHDTSIDFYSENNLKDECLGIDLQRILTIDSIFSFIEITIKQMHFTRDEFRRLMVKYGAIIIPANQMLVIYDPTVSVVSPTPSSESKVVQTLNTIIAQDNKKIVLHCINMSQSIIEITPQGLCITFQKKTILQAVDN